LQASTKVKKSADLRRLVQGSAQAQAKISTVLRNDCSISQADEPPQEKFADNDHADIA
jgi:hypothetical protein